MGSEVPVWMLVDGKMYDRTGLFKDIWDSGFGSVLWFCERFLKVPQAAKIGVAI